MISHSLPALALLCSVAAYSEQPRQVYLEGLLNGMAPIVPVASNGSQPSIGPPIVVPASQSTLFTTVVPRVIPANGGIVQVGTTLLVLPNNGSVFHFINQTTASISPING